MGSLASAKWCPYERSDTPILGAGPGCRCTPGVILPLPLLGRRQSQSQSPASWPQTYLCMCFAAALHTLCGPQGSAEPARQHPLTDGKKNHPYFCRYTDHFRQELRPLSTTSQCHIQGFHFLLFSSLGPGSAKVQPAAAPFSDYWWGLGFIFYTQLCRCARHFTKIYKDRTLKSLYSPNKLQHS